MMQHAPTSHHDSTPHDHNGAAILSIVCIIAWPLTFLIPIVFNVVTGGSGIDSMSPLAFAAFVLACGFGLLPVMSIVAGGIGLYHAAKQPNLRASRWLALSGLLLGSLWFVGTFLLSDAGPALVNWLSHLAR